MGRLPLPAFHRLLRIPPSFPRCYCPIRIERSTAQVSAPPGSFKLKHSVSRVVSIRKARLRSVKMSEIGSTFPRGLPTSADLSGIFPANAKRAEPHCRPFGKLLNFADRCAHLASKIVFFLYDL